MGSIPGGRKWQPTPVFLPAKSHGQRSMGQSIRLQRLGHHWSNLTRTNYSKRDVCKVLRWLGMHTSLRHWRVCSWLVGGWVRCPTRLLWFQADDTSCHGCQDQQGRFCPSWNPCILVPSASRVAVWPVLNLIPHLLWSVCVTEDFLFGPFSRVFTSNSLRCHILHFLPSPFGRRK